MAEKKRKKDKSLMQHSWAVWSLREPVTIDAEVWDRHVSPDEISSSLEESGRASGVPHDYSR